MARRQPKRSAFVRTTINFLDGLVDIAARVILAVWAVWGVIQFLRFLILSAR